MKAASYAGSNYYGVDWNNWMEEVAASANIVNQDMNNLLKVGSDLDTTANELKELVSYFK